MFEDLLVPAEVETLMSAVLLRDSFATVQGKARANELFARVSSLSFHASSFDWK